MDFGPVGKETLETLKSEPFLEYLLRAKIELDSLINGYVTMYRIAGEEKVNHGLTNDRRALLRGILAKDNRDKDDKGNALIRWDIILDLAHKAIRAFNQEDIQR